MTRKTSTQALHRLYGISNCDTVKKARKWLEKNQIDYEFVDFRKDGINSARVKTWLAELGMDILLNKRSTTWKNLDAGDKDNLTPKRAVQLLLDNPTLIKRPVIETSSGRYHAGFNDSDYQSLML